GLGGGGRGVVASGVIAPSRKVHIGCRDGRSEGLAAHAASRRNESRRCASWHLSRWYGAEHNHVSHGDRFALGSSACEPLNDGGACVRTSHQRRRRTTRGKAGRALRYGRLSINPVRRL